MEQTKSSIKKIDETTFHAEIQHGVTLVDFYADWCGPCRMLAPVLEKVASKIENRATIAKLDIDRAQTIAAQLQISSVPTMILFKDGREVGRIVGLRDAQAVQDFVATATG